MEIIIILILLLLLIKSNSKSNKNNENFKKKQNHKSSGDGGIEWKWDAKKNKFVPYKNGKICSTPDVSESSFPTDENIEKEDITEIDYTKAYQARYLLTKNEWHEYKKLQKIAEEKGYIICPKVRLLDIIEPIKGQKKYMTLFYKVQAKHVDFLICDKDIHIKAIIELDDSSHNRDDRIERDQFVDQILKSVGYTVIHTKSVTDNILDIL